MRRRKYTYQNIVNTTQLVYDRTYYDIETIFKNRLQTAPHLIKRLELEKKLKGHAGCVNCLEWSSDGCLLASGSDDNHVIVWDPFRHKKRIDLSTPHRGNIFSVKFLPKSGNELIVSGAADAMLYVYNVTQAEPNVPKWRCNCHNLRVKRIATAPETPYLFWSCAEDGYVLQFDIRQPHTCQSNDKIVLINLNNHSGNYGEVKCIAVNPRRPELLAIGSNDSFARLYDRRMISLDKMAQRTEERSSYTNTNDNLPKGCATYFCPGHISDEKDNWSNRAITYVSFNPDGTELLVNMGGEQIYLYDINKSKEPEYLNLPRFHKNESDDLLDPEDLSMTKRKIPKSVEHEKKLGNDYLENKKFLQAINEYTSAIKKEPKCPVLYLNRATALMRRNWYGDIYAALKDCHTALILDPTYVKAYFRLSRALFELNHIQEASKCLEELKARFPTYATNHGVMMLKKDIDLARTQTTQSRPSWYMGMSDNEKYWRSVSKDYQERFVGHVNTTTDIKEANFFGNDSNYVIAGSDDGNFFIWKRPTNIISEIFRGDKTIVNCVQPHPYICLLATSGIGQEVRLWSPQPEENFISKYRLNSMEENIILKNQQRMQSDPYDIGGPAEQSMVCRTS